MAISLLQLKCLPTTQYMPKKDRKGVKGNEMGSTQNEMGQEWTFKRVNGL